MMDGEKEFSIKIHETLQKACWEAGMLVGSEIFDLPYVVRNIVNNYKLLRETIIVIDQNTNSTTRAINRIKDILYNQDE